MHNSVVLQILFQHIHHTQIPYTLEVKLVLEAAICN